MILAVDVNYRGKEAFAAGVVFRNWTDQTPENETVVYIPEVGNYITGSFYLRELPCILELLKRVPDRPDIVIIDGYVILGEDKKYGLGMHLYNALHKQTAVIGVAKTKFIDTPEYSEVFRGKSKRPLYITSAGIDQEKAKQHILEMHGPNRIPTLLKRADRLSRSSIFLVHGNIL